MTAYTTATDVVLSAMPPISAASQLPPQDEPAEPECGQQREQEGDESDGQARLPVSRRDTGSISATAP
jgi:hypothetical protein